MVLSTMMLYQSIMENLARLALQGIAPAPPVIASFPLKESWSLWYHDIGKKTWMENLHFVVRLSTVEDFWCIFSSIRKACELPIGSGFSFFRTGIRPCWEDQSNQYGGRWEFTVDIFNRERCSTFWDRTVLMLIAEVFEKVGFICGVSMRVRLLDVKICFWVHANSQSHGKLLEIGKIIKNGVGLCDCFDLRYRTHRDCQLRGNLRPRPMLTI
jgi:hypothetical protein